MNGAVLMTGGALLVGGAVYGAGEWLSARWGIDVRPVIYTGAGAGALLALSGLPFAWLVKRSAPHDPNGAQTWKWWGTGLLVRLGLLLLFSVPVAFDLFPRYATTGRMTMMAVYLTLFFAEVAWLANELLKPNNAIKPKA